MRIILFSVVTYNSGDVIEELLSGLRREEAACESAGFSLRLRIFDNGSTDDTLERIARVGYADCVTVGEANIGFGAGHNRNCLSEPSDFVVISNPDIRVRPGAFETLSATFDSDETIGMVLPRLYFPDGSEQHLCKRDPTLTDIVLRRFAPRFVQSLFRKRMARYTMEDHDYSQAFSVEYGSGSFMALRSSVYKAVGGFDERYFMYIEDADLTRKVRCHGYRCLYVPTVEVVHHWAQGSYKSLRLAWINIVSVLKYLFKWNVAERLRRRAGPMAARRGSL